MIKRERLQQLRARLATGPLTVDECRELLDSALYGLTLVEELQDVRELFQEVVQQREAYKREAAEWKLEYQRMEEIARSRT